MSANSNCKNYHPDWLLEIGWLHVSEPVLLLFPAMLDMWQPKLSLCQSSPYWALLEASGSSVCKGDKPGTWCLFNGSLCSVLVFLTPFHLPISLAFYHEFSVLFLYHSWQDDPLYSFISLALQGKRCHTIQWFFPASSWTLIFTGLSYFNMFPYHPFVPSKKLYSFSDPRSITLPSSMATLVSEIGLPDVAPPPLNSCVS